MHAQGQKRPLGQVSLFSAAVFLRLIDTFFGEFEWKLLWLISQMLR